MKHYSNILMPYDGSNISGDALDVAVTMAENHDAKLTILYVHDTSMDGGSIWPSLASEGDPHLLQSQMNITSAPSPIHMPENVPYEEEERIKKDIPGSIIASAKGRVRSNIEVAYKTVNGKAAKEIMRYTEENDIDLVVMGGRGLSGMKRFTMGSVSHKVSNEVACSILVVR